MNPIRRYLPSYTQLSEEQAELLSYNTGEWYTTSITNIPDSKLPESLTATVRGMMELQTKWLGFGNASPVISYEIRRPTSDNLEFQYSLPTKRLERKLRTQLTNEIPDLKFKHGTDGLPVTEDDSVGGAILTTGRRDWYPLRTEFDFPPINSLASTLHRHAMQNTRFVIQVLFQPVIGNPVKNWWRTRRTYQHIGFLRKEKEKLWGGRPPTPREKQQANAIEDKAGTRRFHTTIRILIIGAKDYTPRRVKETAGGFNIFESPDTGQYLNTSTIRSPLHSRIYSFAKTVNNRRFGAWHRSFQASIPELAALISLPDRNQRNIHNTQP